MPNKLKDIFSNDTFKINGKMRFENEEAYKSFLSALELVQNEGRVVPVKGVTSITTEVSTQGGNYPIYDSINISDLVIGPSSESIDLSIDIDEGKENIQLNRYHITDGIILETHSKAVVHFKFIFYSNGTNKHTVQYKIQFKYAKSINEIVDGYKRAIGLLNLLYRDEDAPSNDDYTALKKVKNQLRYSLEAFIRLSKVEQQLGLNFNPEHLENFTDDNQRDVEELYILLCKKEVLRLSSNLTEVNSNATMIQQANKSLAIGNLVKLTFLGTIQYNLFGQTITLHSSSLLSNAIIKEIEENEENVKVYYGGADSNPMYVSYRAFLSEDDAKKEMSSIMQHEELYTNAKTIQQYLEEYIK